MSSLSRVCSRSASQMPRSAWTLSAPMKARSNDRRCTAASASGPTKAWLRGRSRPPRAMTSMPTLSVSVPMALMPAVTTVSSVSSGVLVMASARAPIVEPASRSTVSPGSIWSAAQRAMSRLAACASPSRCRSEASGWWARLMTPPYVRASLPCAVSLARSRRIVEAVTPSWSESSSTLASPLVVARRTISPLRVCAVCFATLGTLGVRRPGRHLRTEAQRLDHRPVVGDTGAGDVEGRAVVDGGADDGQPDRDVDARLEPEHLDGPVPLVVVHRDDEVVVAAAGEEEEGVGRERAVHVDAVGASRLDPRVDLRLLLAVAEEAVLAGVGVDAAHADLGVRVARVDESLVAATDDALDETGLDPGDGVDEADVGGDVDDLDPLGR